jgi:hypothetical protein
MGEGALKSEIAQRVAARVADIAGRDAMRVEYPSYVRALRYNLAPGIEAGDFHGDFEGADGGELVSSGGRPEKLCAVHSSAALVVNTFAPYRRAPESLSLVGRTGFAFACFEKKLRTGLGGTPPNLDFYAIGDEAVVAVESKFTEVLSKKTANFSESYSRAIAELADARWSDMFHSLCAERLRFRYVDAAQLVKHYLGIRHSLADEEVPKALVYLFWEPTNWPEVPAYSQHRGEVLEFSMAVAGGAVEFTAMSYAELWNAWEADGVWSGAEERLEYLRKRYLFAV